MIDFIVENLQYWIISCVTLYCWDLVDMYVAVRHFKFIRSTGFGVYYWIRSFFCIALMEIGTMVGILNFDTKYAIAFIVPLSFSAILQNLVVKLGGVDKSVNIAEVFEKFKFRIEEAIIKREEARNVMLQNELFQSDVDTGTIGAACRLYMKKPKEFEDLAETIMKLIESEDERGAEERQRIEYIAWLGAKGGMDIIKELLERKFPTREIKQAD